jgi:hypothetical protein
MDAIIINEPLETGVMQLFSIICYKWGCAGGFEFKLPANFNVVKISRPACGTYTQKSINRL